MLKAPLLLRFGLHLSPQALNALVLHPDGSLHAFATPTSPGASLHATFTALLSRITPTLPQKVPLGEAIVTSSRPLSTLRPSGRVALLITEGFEDTLQLEDSQIRPSSIFGEQRLFELCPRKYCLGVPERLSADGTVIRPLTGAALLDLYQQVAKLNVSAVAVVLLHSYQNDAHERTIAEALRPLGLPVSLSSVVARRPDERRRAYATVLDACLAPTFQEEISVLRAAGFSRVLCCNSVGDLVPASQMLPLHSMLGAAAAGLRGVQRIAAINGLSQFLALGIDGNSATVALYDSKLEHNSNAQEMFPIGFDFGQELPAHELKIISLDTAFSNCGPQLLDALHAITIERGNDPADYALVCYGNVSASLATTLASQIGAKSMYMPPTAPLLAAYGALCAPIVCQHQELMLTEASNAQQIGQLAATISSLTSRLRADLRREGLLVSDHLPGYEWHAELCYKGQGLGQWPALTLAGLGDGSPALSGDTDVVVRFFHEHHRRYGFSLAECPVEILRVRVRATLPVITPHDVELSKLAVPL